MSETKRVHISGLNPTQCSVQDLHNRFESFQLQVLQVHNWPPGKDGVDNVQNWCFLTLKGDAAKIKRATEVLNGTIWKGSKLRIGTAKGERGREGKVEERSKPEEEGEQSDKPKKTRKTKGIESRKVDQPVSIKDVEDGEWGWKKTPAGHLLRPLHMRPSHPLPLASARPVVETVETEKKERKRKAKGSRPLTRAKRVTVDPSRYGAVHLAGTILDDGTDSLPPGYTWTCQETESGDVEWMLKDKDGNVMKQERIQLVKERNKEEVLSDSESNFDTEDESSMDEVAAAINNAVPDSSSDEEEEDEKEGRNAVTVRKVAEKIKPVEIPIHDEEEDSDFSEGYQEVQAGLDVLPKDWQEEKAGHLELLKNMFGDEGVTLTAQSIAKEDQLEQNEDSEEEEIEATSMAAEAPLNALTAGAQKRAALLGAFTSEQQTSKSFRPLIRFDPGMGAAEDGEGDVEMEERDDAQEPAQAESGTTTILEISRNDRVQMSSLKDMFKPKEDSKGFTLLGDLDLDLEEEDEEEDMPEVESVPARQALPTYQPEHRVAPIKSKSVKLPFIFPTLDANDKSWLSILRNDRSVGSFCKDKTDEEIQIQWKERKGQLTQDYKRRHREALKKKKRKYTGSRAAGTSMPLRS